MPYLFSLFLIAESSALLLPASRELGPVVSPCSLASQARKMMISYQTRMRARMDIVLMIWAHAQHDLFQSREVMTASSYSPATIEIPSSRLCIFLRDRFSSPIQYRLQPKSHRNMMTGKSMMTIMRLWIDKDRHPWIVNGNGSKIFMKSESAFPRALCRRSSVRERKIVCTQLYVLCQDFDERCSFLH